MKKLALIITGIVLFAVLCGCPDPVRRPNVIENWILRYETVPLEKITRAADENYDLIYSAYDADNELNYYVYLLGHINSVPVAYRQAVIYDGMTPVTISYSSTTTNAYTVTEGVEKASEYSFTTNQSHNWKVGTELGIKGEVFSFKVSAEVGGQYGHEEMNGRSLSNTYETSMTKSSETTDTIEATIGEHGQPAGKYRYSLFCTTDVYYVLATNKGKTAVEEAYIAVCARPASYAWGIDYESDLGGNFGKNAPGDLFSIPELVLAELPEPADEFEEEKIPLVPPVATPAATLPSGIYIGQQYVLLSCTTDGARIHYTTNGSNPSTSSSIYNSGAQIIISQNTTLKAYAVKDGMLDSQIMTESYTITEAVNYVNKIYFGYSSNKSVALSSLRSQTSENMVIIEKDLNEGAGGNYIFIGYTITNNPSAAIRGLMVDNSGKNPPASFTSSSSTYQQIGPDLNLGASGDYIWLYETRNAAAGEPLRNLFVQIDADQGGMAGSGWSRVEFRSGVNPDLNRGAGGKYIYLWMQK